jgi:hypothetical protein
MAAASGRLALKRRMAVSAGDLDLAQTMEVGLAAAAAPAPAAAAAPTVAAGMYNLVRWTSPLPAAPVAQQRLPASPASDRADQRWHGPRGHNCGGSSAVLRVGGAASVGGGGWRRQHQYCIRWQWCDLNLCRPNLAHVC